MSEENDPKVYTWWMDVVPSNPKKRDALLNRIHIYIYRERERGVFLQDVP